MGVTCFACGGRFGDADADGPVHPYMLSAPACWAAYGEMLAREYQNPALFGEVHRLTVDAYALQHPGDPADRRARQSVWVHYAGLHLALVQGLPHAQIPPIMQRLAGGDFPPLPHAPAAFAVTLADVMAQGEAHHAAAVKAWAECALNAWAPLEHPARAMLAALLPA